MNETASSLLEQKIQSTAQELLANGYRVSIEPSAAELPFDLGGYRPDLIATKDNEGLIMEIKNTFKRVSVDFIKEVAARVATHQGWRFLLLTIDDNGSEVVPTDREKIPSWEELARRSSSIDKLISDSMLEPALLFLCSIIEATLRKRAIEKNIPVWRLPEKEVLNHLFSNGEIYMADLDIFNTCFNLRNRVAHGLQIPIDVGVINSAHNSIKNLLAEWSYSSTK